MVEHQVTYPLCPEHSFNFFKGEAINHFEKFYISWNEWETLCTWIRSNIHTKAGLSLLTKIYTRKGKLCCKSLNPSASDKSFEAQQNTLILYERTLSLDPEVPNSSLRIADTVEVTGNLYIATLSGRTYQRLCSEMVVCKGHSVQLAVLLTLQVAGNWHQWADINSQLTSEAKSYPLLSPCDLEITPSDPLIWERSG